MMYYSYKFLLLVGLISFVRSGTVVSSTTNWNSISSLLETTWKDYLPPIPSNGIQVTWNDNTNVPFTFVGLDHTNAQGGCGTSKPNPVYPNDAISYGTVHNESQSCRVRVRIAPYMDFVNRNLTSIWQPVQAQPSWIQARFPIPDNAVPTSIDVRLDTRYPLRMFGGNPCEEATNNPNYECRINVQGPWDRSVPAGYFLLWTTPGSTGHIITGPYTDRTPTVLVPSSFNNTNTRELIVTMFVFNQYPTENECPTSGNCGTDVVLGSLVRLTLQTRTPFTYPKAPPQTRPRLFGDNNEWMAENTKMDNIPCGDARSPWGGLSDIRHNWELSIWTGSTCTNSRKALLVNHTIAAKYFDASFGQVNNEEAMRIMFMIRRVRHCHATQSAGSCPYPLADINQLASLVIEREFSFFSSWSWENQGLGFDLGTLPPMRFWCLYLDIFWDELTSSQKQTISNRMSTAINLFINHFDNRHWALYNGNNWTPFLALPAVYWGLTFYYEDPRAADIIHKAIDIMYLHTPAYKDDGAYYEGVAVYSFMSLDSIVEMNRLLIPAFGKGSEAMVPSRMEKFPFWHLDSIATDGLMVDFGDSHSQRGWSGWSTLNGDIWQELMGYGTVNPNHCVARGYWMNHYFSHGLTNPWTIPVATAVKDWQGLVSQPCPDENTIAVGTPRASFYPDVKYGAIRTRLRPPNPNPLTRADQVYQVFMAIQGKDNRTPHSELDFATFIWSAYGTRLIADLGYGRISGAPGRSSQLDGNPKGHNTVYVEEADGTGETNLSQFDFEDGEMSLSKISGYDVFVLDGSAVYGRDKEDGWFDQFYRSFIALPGGDIIITDFFRAKSARGSLTVHENFYGGHTTATTTCDAATNVNMTVVNQNLLVLRPDCNPDRTTSISLGYIYGHSLNNNGRFQYDGVINYPTQTSSSSKHRTRFLSTGPISSDLRIFVLSAVNRTTTTHTVGVESNNNNTNAPYFRVSIGSTRYRIQFARGSSSNPLLLSCISSSTSPQEPSPCNPSGTSSSSQTSAQTSTSQTSAQTSSTSSSQATSTSSSQTSSQTSSVSSSQTGGQTSSVSSSQVTSGSDLTSTTSSIISSGLSDDSSKLEEDNSSSVFENPVIIGAVAGAIGLIGIAVIVTVIWRKKKSSSTSSSWI